MLKFAREIAQGILDEDHQIEHPDNFFLCRQLQKLGGNRYNGGLIS
ncbi:MAG: hypothetical protein LBV43_06350 [Prevotella sp.]|nr:hypothetical protein [Prevotella sp.]